MVEKVTISVSLKKIHFPKDFGTGTFNITSYDQLLHPYFSVSHPPIT